MNPAVPVLVPVDGLITVTAGHTPSTLIHDPESPYSRYFWVPQIGPLSYLTIVALTAWLPADDASIRLDFD